MTIKRYVYQDTFAGYLAELIVWLRENGYHVVIGEVYRSPEEAKRNTEKGTGIENSLHTVCMAADISLFVNGEYLTKSEDYKKAGEFWESLDPANNWGGHFNDGNHFSHSYPVGSFKGVK